MVFDYFVQYLKQIWYNTDKEISKDLQFMIRNATEMSCQCANVPKYDVIFYVWRGRNSKTHCAVAKTRQDHRAIMAKVDSDFDFPYFQQLQERMRIFWMIGESK